MCFYAPNEIYDMEQPHAAENGTRDIQILAEHHKEAKRHQKRYCNHNLDFGVQSHTLTLYIGFQIVFIELRTDEPLMQSLRAFAEAERCKEKKRKGRQHRQNNTDCTDTKSNKSKYDP